MSSIRRWASPWWWRTAPAPAAGSGAELVARSAPDGYTLLVGSNGPLTVNPFVNANISYIRSRTSRRWRW